MTDSETIKNCMARIRSKYARKGRLEAWDDATREDFIRAFSLVPMPLLTAVVDEMLLNPPSDDRGRIDNWLPDPADIVSIARRMTQEAGRSPSDIVREIMGCIAESGRYGVRDPRRPTITYEGSPLLSPMAAQVVASMGGWMALCEMEAPAGVINGLLLKHAADTATEDKNRPLLVGRIEGKPMETIGETARALSGNGKNGAKR